MRTNILDNQSERMVDYLRDHLPNAEIFRLVSAYFSVQGFAALAEQLKSPDLRVNFLFGDPASVGETTSGDKEHWRFDLTEDGLSPETVVTQRLLAERCTEWVKRKDVKIRTISKANFLHGKMYHLGSSQNDSVATVGSSNFTLNGLGASKSPNIELNIAIQSADTRQRLSEWFDSLWNNKALTKNAKTELLAALARWHKEYSPEFLYYKTLLELFRDVIDAEIAAAERVDASHLYDSEIWKTLYEFQRDGAKSVISRLRRHNGCILADSVGLGKTYTALSVIKYYELSRKRVLVICPKKLENNWRVYQASSAASSNPFRDDQFTFSLLSHTDLSRDRGMAGNIDLADFDWSDFDMVVIDESHNFRNESTASANNKGGSIRLGRYEKLLKEVITSGASTKVLMLSATPVNTSLTDLRNQIHLITARQDDYFAETLGVPSIREAFKHAQDKYKEWEQQGGKHDKQKLLKQLGGDFLHLLSNLTIARSRRQIKKYYSDDIKKLGDFPARNKPVNVAPHTDTRGELSYEEMYGHITDVKFRLYQPSKYVKVSQAETQQDVEQSKYVSKQRDREEYLAAMIRVNLLKRLESSANSLASTLGRMICKTVVQIEHIEKFERTKNADLETFSESSMPDYDDEEGDFWVGTNDLGTYHLSKLNVADWRKDLIKDRDALAQAHDLIEQIDVSRDNKLRELERQIKAKARKKNRKLLVFTSFRDTGEYLYDNLRGLASDLHLNIAFIAGGDAKTECTKKSFNDILDNFAPFARRKNSPPEQEQIHLLIATDCISEGQNLQDCDTVLNYDIHWNPVRLIQRLGRIDRIGTRHKSVNMINFWPTEDLELYLKLQPRVRARMALIDATATGDDDNLDEGSEQLEFQFRDSQLRKMRDEIIDLEDLPDTLSIGDLTLDDFLTQLLRYLQKNRAELEEAPPGIYAVADSADARGYPGRTQPGVIFFFRQRRADAQRRQNPTHPFFFVQVSESGVRRGYTEAKAILELFATLTHRKEKPHIKLCDAFIAEIKSNSGKKSYDLMLQKAVKWIVKGSAEAAFKSLGVHAGNPDAKLPSPSETPSMDNLELLTWLVIKEHVK